MFPFWLAYVLTRPQGADVGDRLASPNLAQPGEPAGLAPAGLGLLAVATTGLLVWAHGRPRVGPAPEEDNTSAVQMAPGQAVKRFPPAKVAALKTLASTSLKDARPGNAKGAHARADALLKVTFKALRRFSLDPAGITRIAQASLVLLRLERGRTA